MHLSSLDVTIVVVFMAAVIAIGLFMSRKETSSETTSEDYFLAGRGLNWWLIGFSLIAANISAEQFVGMSGQAARASIGLAVASYEWIAAVSLIAVAFFFLPTFLRSGIFTLPEFLEYRFNHAARVAMSLMMVLIYVGVTIATVTFLGAKALDPLFSGTFLGIPINITSLSWMVGILAAIYVAVGGLQACAWADLLQGSALILGGAVILVLSLQALDRPDQFEGASAASVSQALGVDADATLGEKLAKLKEHHMHMILPRDSSFLPWTALLFGIWIPNLYYWGLNQYIMQRTLGASALAEGQRGVVFAAYLKLIIPFIVCIPGIIAFPLYADRMKENAMEDPSLNAPILEAFEKARGDSAGSRLIFPFDADFAGVHRDLAGKVLAHNAAVLREPGSNAIGTDAEDLWKENQSLVAMARSQNQQSRKDLAESSEYRPYALQQTLVGYDYDGAFPLLIRYLTPNGWRGFVLAALMGAVISSLAAMLNAASTIFTMDVYREWFRRDASQQELVSVGRICVPICVIIGCLVAPLLADPKFQGAFAYIQEFQGFVSPGILVVFLFGIFVHRAPRICGIVGLLVGPVIYGFLYFNYADMAFLNRMAIAFTAVTAVLAGLTLWRPLPEPVSLPQQVRISMAESRGAKLAGLGVLILTALLYWYFA